MINAQAKRAVGQQLKDIYAEHRQGLFTLALSITRCPARAEDAVHDAFARLCRGWNAAQSNQPVAYVYAAVRNAAVDQTRRSGPPGSGDATIFNGRAPGADTEALTAEQEKLIAAALGELSPEHREVVVLKIYAGLTFNQIAAIVESPLQTVATRYRRALEQLRTSLRRLL